MSLPTVALSIRQPWAWLILNEEKDIENRSWKTNFRGRVLIHAAKGMTRAEYENTFYFCRNCIPHIKTAYQYPLPAFDELKRGGIIGSVEIVDCVTKSTSPWFMGHYGFVLQDPQPLPFHPCPGQLGFFPCRHPYVSLDDLKEAIKSKEAA